MSDSAYRVETTSRLAQWRIDNLASCTYRKSDPFKIGKWNWHLSVEKNRVLFVRLYPEISNLTRDNPPIASFIIRVVCSVGDRKALTHPEVTNKKLKSNDDFVWAIDVPLTGKFIIDIEFLDLKTAYGALPLPSPQVAAALRTMGSFKSVTNSGPLYASGPLPLPPTAALPTGTIPTGTLRNFLYEEIASACHNFSSDRCMSEGLSSIIYKASFGDDSLSSKKFEATVTRLHPSTQGLREFINEINTLATLQHPNLCKLLGFHAREGSEQKMLVYERLYHGSLDRLLYGRSEKPPIDWNTRMKIALCAAQGLTFLHEEGPFQAMYNEFSTANIQIDKDFSAKLSGYGCVGQIPEAEISNSSVAVANLSVETLERGMLTPKSNVWSFGIVLLELLTGRRNLDSRHPKEERNLVKWSRPFLADDCRLSLIMDPQLKGRFPSQAARRVSDIAQKCLQKDPSERPTMRTVVQHLKIIQDMKHSCRFPLQEPAFAGKHMSRSPSLNGILTPAPRLSFSPSPPSAARPSISPTRRPALLTALPPRACSSTLTFEGLDRQESQKSSSSTVPRASVEGF